MGFIMSGTSDLFIFIKMVNIFFGNIEKNAKVLKFSSIFQNFGIYSRLKNHVGEIILSLYST